MDENELRTRFPDLDVSSRSPMMQQVNGFGTRLLFRSEVDRSTRSYVKTLWLTALWIPIAPIASYRVVDAPGGGWFILGRQPLSPVQKAARIGIAAGGAALVFGIAWGIYSETDGYKNKQQMERAQDSVQAGDLEDAARRYRLLARTAPDLRDDARTGIAQLLASVRPETPADVATAVFQSAQDAGDGRGPVVPDLWTHVSRYAEARAPEGAEKQMEWLSGFAELAPDENARTQTRKRLVAIGAARTPPDLWALSELATELAAAGDLARAEELLAPHAKSLRANEGARILGQIRFDQGRTDEAFQLLEPYVTARLADFRAASDAFDEASATAQKHAIEGLDAQEAPASWYAAYEAADETKRGEMVRDYVVAEMNKDKSLAAARAELVNRAAVVPVALDLGVVRVIRARSTELPAESQRELEAAEAIFNAIGGVAADDPEFRFAAARVAYWLGKREEYEAHLAAGVEAAGGGCDAMLAGAGLVASLGEREAAEKRYSAAYKAAKSDQERYAAAHGAGIQTEDTAESIRWLERSDLKDASVAAALAERRARVAFEAGDRELTVRHLKEALAHYDKLPRSATTLNNAAIAAQFLSAVGGDVSILEDAAARMRAAIKEMPTNIVLISNTASTLHSLAWARGAGSGVDLTIGAESWLKSRYDDEKTEDAVLRPVVEGEDMREAIRLSDRVLSLAPTNVGMLELRASIAEVSRDAARLRQLLALALSPEIDRAAMRKEYLEAQARDPVRESLDAHRTHLAARIAATPADAPESLRATLEALDVHTALALWATGAPSDLEALDKRARALRARAATAATFAAERAVAAARLHDALCARSPRYKAAAARTLRACGIDLLMAEALHRDRTLLAAVRTTPEFVRVADFAEASLRRFPTTAGPATRAWLLLAGRRAVGSDGTAADEPALWMLPSRVGSALRPFDAAHALSTAWTYRLVGDPAAEAAVLAACAKDTGLIPFRD